MLLRSIGAALLTASAVHGFRDSSPFVMLSTQPSSGGIESAVINTAEKVTDGILETVGDCAQSKYFIIRQPGLAIADLQNSGLLSLNRLADHKEYEQRVTIENVMRPIASETLAGDIASKCGATDEYMSPGGLLFSYTGEGKEVTLRTLPALPRSNEPKERAEALESSLHDLIKLHGPSLTEDHVIILLGAPSTGPAHIEYLYEMDKPYPSALHQDLKRGIEYKQLDASNHSMQAGLPLFEKYQFLSPGIFMALTVSLLLFVILWVGVSAIAGLEVSYMAFSKEMGPAAQNKGKQQ